MPKRHRGRRGGPDRSPPPLVSEPEPEQGLEPEQGPEQEVMEDEGEGDKEIRWRKTMTTSPPLGRSGGGGDWRSWRERLNPTSRRQQLRESIVSDGIGGEWRTNRTGGSIYNGERPECETARD